LQYLAILHSDFQIGVVMKGRHIIGLSILLIIACIGLHNGYTALFAMHNLVFCIDDHITDTEKHAIMTYIHTLHERANIPTSDNILPIQQQFPFVESIHITLLPNSMMQYTVHISQPCCIVNQELAFIKNNTLTHKQIFNPTSIQNLPSVFVDEIALQKKHGLHNFQHCITSLSQDLLNDYNVAWFSEVYVRLHEKNHPQFSIIFSADRLPDTRTISACTAIKQDLVKQALLQNTPLLAKLPLKKNTFEKKRQLNTSNWAADIRFNNQIVLYAEKGDRGHG